MLCRYVGWGPCTTAALPPLSTFGQQVEVPDEYVVEFVNCPRGPLLIPESEWQKLGISDEDVERYGAPADRYNATDADTNKMRAAIAACQAFKGQFATAAGDCGCGQN